ncbi:MAG TPA: PAS domain-containing protein, partial [Acidobacteriota bacterium]|nr:PAS domain-containing protein [Acidobacteriota bacterium]
RIHPADKDRLAHSIEEAFRSDKNLWEDEYRYLRADGSYAVVIDRGYIIRDKDGAPERMVGALLDVTRRRQAEETARLYGDIFRNMQIGLYVHQLQDLNDDTTFRVVAANPAAEKITGVPAADIIGKNLDQCFPRLRERGIPQLYAEVVRTGKELHFEDILYGDDHIPYSHYSARFFPLPDLCVGVAFEDVSPRLRAEAQLRRVENRFQVLASVLPVGIYQNDAEGNCVYVNQKCCELCGVERNELLGKNWAKFLHPEDRRRITGRWQTAVRRQSPFQAEYRFKRPDGTIVWVLGQAIPELDDAGEFTGFIGSITDITERKSLENEILGISAQEQQRIGQALHDRLGQHLTGIAFLAKALSQKLGTREPEKASAADEISTLINQAILGTRDLARMLHPVELEENGLIAAFQDLVSNASRMFNISCRFHCDSSISFRDNTVATHLYHIAQEAITNAVKHGHASSVTVELGEENERAYLKVRDNGEGIPDDYRKSQGIGLRIMKHRAAMIDAELQIERLPRGGTLLTCAFTAPESMRAGENV